ncbi:cytidine deaminase family protein [Telluribacter humicola]|uniref:cytidine deaminase family protein n=1 Tax=Telluribacter humicola TaxID=1720261 RepID=UPI00286E8418|nr:cytidine deaminase [Telluribacter humicola]
MNKVQLNICLTSYPTESELPEAEQQLMEAARQATRKSYAPYSNFHVGAAVLLEDGTVFTAGNQENAAFPSGSCAEQSVIYWVGANYPDKQIQSIAVVARPGEARPGLAGPGVAQPSQQEEYKPVSPCGACRQSLLEYEHRQKQPIRLLMMRPDGGVIVSESISNLLPVKFDADDLRG